tara:strand:- start:14 stop:205 length:192 start_codon:yes stop_codon:yes gene_type:complete
MSSKELEESKKVGKEILDNLGPKMDQKNKQIAKVWAEKGDKEAVKKMMENSNFDYSRMRSMYG